MTARLPPEQLRSLLRRPLPELTARAAQQLAGALGPAAPWLLCDAVLDRLAEEDPAFERVPRPFRPAHFSDAAGSCTVIYAGEDPQTYPLVRPAFLLPLQWRQGGEHDRCLPYKLREEADRVCRHLELPGWSLHLLPPLQGLDLNGFDDVLEHRSGWAPLAGGLCIATQGGKPRPEVWATGRWDGDGGIEAVGGLAEKLDLARRWGATDVFVPERQADGGVDGLRLGKLRSGLREPREALREYLAALDAPPPRDAGRQERIDFFFRQHPQASATGDYYRSNLLPDIIADRRQQVEADYAGWRPTHLVTVVSHNPELILMAAGVLRVRHCLLLYTEDLKGIAERTREQLSSAEHATVTAKLASFGDDTGMPEHLWREIAPFAQGVGDDEVVFDVTPGSKLMTLALELLARRFRPEAWLIYMRQQMRDRRVIPFSEKLTRWRAKETKGPFAELSPEAARAGHGRV